MSKWLYRLESAIPSRGLWYNSYNQYVCNIGEIDGCMTKNMQIGYDERYQKDGRNWYSSCSSIERVVIDINDLFKSGE